MRRNILENIPGMKEFSPESREQIISRKERTLDEESRGIMMSSEILNS